MSDSQFRRLVRAAIASGSRLDFEAAIHFGRRIGMDCWELLDNEIPLILLAPEIAQLCPPLDNDSISIADVVASGIVVSSDVTPLPQIPPHIIDYEYISARRGKYPTLEMCDTKEIYWETARDYILLQQGALLQYLGWGDYKLITDPQIRSDFVTLSYQTDVIAEARKLIVEEAAGSDPILKTILAWNMAYNGGTLSDPKIMDVNGLEVRFWPVGRNSSCSFMVGLHGSQRYRYSWCEDDTEPTVRMVDDWGGYYGHF